MAVGSHARHHGASSESRATHGNMEEPDNQPANCRAAPKSNDMILLITEDFATRSGDWNPVVVMTNTMPPRDPDDDDNDLEEDLEDEEDEDQPDEPPIVREPDEDEP
jgi:hypothetical protein